MKPDQIYQAQRLNSERNSLRTKLELVERGGFMVSISGTYQDKQVTEAARMSVAAEFARRIAAVESELIELGVEID